MSKLEDEEKKLLKNADGKTKSLKLWIEKLESMQNILQSEGMGKSTFVYYV